VTERRTRERPERKWLANELAALQGELNSIDEQLVRLAKRRIQVEAACQALSQVASMVGAASLVARTAPVRAQTGWGQLRALLTEILQAVAPQALDTVTMTKMVAERFGLVLASRDELTRFRKNTLTRQLRKMERDGLVERLHDVNATPSLVGVWRWAAEAAVPTLEELTREHGGLG
jgi:hypothetical protein